MIEHDAPITRYYERLAAVQQRGSQASHQVLRDLLKDIMTNQVPRTILKEWAMHTFQDATDYWTFRSTVSERVGRSHCSYRAIPNAIFFPRVILSTFVSNYCSWWFGILGSGSWIGFLGWGFQLMGFGACVVGLSGFYGVGALYINIKE